MSFSSTTETELKDHVSIGEQKKLFCRNDASPGSIFWLPDGTRMYKTLVDYLEMSLKKQKYLPVKTPFIYKKDMWQQTGHWDKYKENMFLINEGLTEAEDGTESTFGLKPMNCPGHAIIFDKCVQSERDLPLRLMEFGVVHRNEPSNSLRGLFRLRQFTQDDAHIFCTMKHVENEINEIIKFIKEFYSYFGFKYSAKVSTRPKESIGDDETWNIAEEILKKCIVNLDDKFTIDEGDGAFYGPKIDITITDSRGREWQCGTIQLDFNMAKTMNLSYALIGEQNQSVYGSPVVIHRAVLGSVERFIGILLEHSQGKLPFWLDSKQIYIAPVKDTCDKETYDYITYLTKTFGNYNVNVDLSNNSFPKKIKNAEMEGYHYIFIVGPNEVKNVTLSYRNKGDKKNNQNVKDVYEMIEKKEYAFMS